MILQNIKTDGTKATRIIVVSKAIDRRPVFEVDVACSNWYEFRSTRKSSEEQKVLDILFDSSDSCDLCFVLLNSCRACDYFIIIRLEYQLIVKQDFEFILFVNHSGGIDLDQNTFSHFVPTESPVRNT